MGPFLVGDYGGSAWSLQPAHDVCTVLHALADDAGPPADALCAVVSFEDAAGRLLGLIYLFENARFHPFV